MGSPAQFAHLVNFAAALRKPGLIAFQTFNAVDSDYLRVIIDMPSSAPSSTTKTTAVIPWSSNLVINAGAAQVQFITVTGNINSLVIDGSPLNGQELELRFTQGPPGGWIVDLDGIVRDSGFSVDPTSGITTVLPLIYVGGQWIFEQSAFTVPSP